MSRIWRSVLLVFCVVKSLNGIVNQILVKCSQFRFHYFFLFLFFYVSTTLQLLRSLHLQHWLSRRGPVGHGHLPLAEQVPVAVAVHHSILVDVVLARLKVCADFVPHLSVWDEIIPVDFVQAAVVPALSIELDQVLDGAVLADGAGAARTQHGVQARLTRKNI